jgi:phosphatidylserine/phosphatidylglycerophosphate/cardiolipin synthase-like enzyme
MDVLYLATGFTGALTAVWLARLARHRLHPPLTVTPHFSPGGGCTDVVVREIAAARREVLVLAYGFTSRPIAQALVDAKLRGVTVEVVLDHSNETDAHSDLPFLLEQGLVPLIDAHHAIAHNKVIVLDGKSVLTGSFNFTQHAETHNAENLVVIKGHPDLAHAYRQDFQHHKSHAHPAAGEHKPAAHKEPAHPHEAHAHAEGAEKAGHADADAPVLTPAAAELFSRLKQELAEEPGGEHHEGKGKKKAA